MALINPVQKEIEKAQRDIDSLHRHYNVYFQGGEDHPPRQERQALDNQLEKIKDELAVTSNAAIKFQARNLISRYRTMCARWDKTLKGIENGTVVRPKRER